MLYPLVGELLSEKYHSDIKTVYTATIEDTDAAELTAQREAAEQYNAMLSGAAITEGGASAPPLAYAQQLTVGGVMCYVEIPKIGVYLPVEHGTSADTLEKSVGHVVGTSLPVGGASTHAVLSAHSGMASSKLFSDIDQLAELYDDFFIYEVERPNSQSKKKNNTYAEYIMTNYDPRIFAPQMTLFDDYDSNGKACRLVHIPHRPLHEIGGQ